MNPEASCLFEGVGEENVSGKGRGWLMGKADGMAGKWENTKGYDHRGNGAIGSIVASQDHE